MRWFSRVAIPCALALALAAPGWAADVIHATSSVELSHDPGFDGYYKYTVYVTWQLDTHDLGHLDLFLDLEAFNDTCNGSAVRFPSPAGSSSGENALGEACGLTYRGEFQCKTDPSLQLGSMEATVKFEPLEADCFTSTSGSGQFVFYSVVGPSPAVLHGSAVAIKHGQEIDFGDLVGPMPQLGGGLDLLTPVVINEFLVRPFGTAREFVELFNNTADPVDLGNWSIQVWDRDSTFLSQSNLEPGTVLQPGGFLVQADSTFFQYCPDCIGEPGQVNPEPVLAGVDFLFDEGGIIVLKDPQGTIVDQVGYGNCGGAPISCPIIVPAGRTRPPGFEGGFQVAFEPTGLEAATASEPETLSSSTNRIPDGSDTNVDGTDFSIGSPTPESSNVASTPDLGSSTRINSVYVYPVNGDGDPNNESIEFYNATSQTKNLRDYHISDGYYIQPMFPAGGEIPLEPGQKYTVHHGINGTISFEFEEEDRVDLYEPRPAGLTRIDQLGWSRLPSFFPDSCFTRIPDGVGPSGGWDWNTSGGFVNLFYVDNCGLDAPSVAVEPRSAGGAALSAPWPNPALGSARVEFTVSGGAATPAHLGVFDVSGRRVRTLARGAYEPGRHAAVWDGATDGGQPVAAGIYFVRLYVAGAAVGPARPLVWLR